ncbi:hypothetical protein [Clostridium weizhouense]|uniref:Uncharacterized protein n=1 Tax=Clostridium weizhouense TaxID=2859781 RepID=A0ABS7ARQ5_9CLOT|nr:hypothetical protein [Clostridium weizhouense]MBW6411362.1 hypothetical protein [Clostridium weizhouense]
MDDAFVIQLKNLAIQLGEAGIQYAIESLADWIIPKNTLTLNSDGGTEVVRTISFEDGTTFDIIIRLRQEMVIELLSKSSKLIYNSYVTEFSEEGNQCPNYEDNVSVQIKAHSPDKGGISLINGLIGINW